jgi:chromosome segregation ATPase
MISKLESQMGAEAQEKAYCDEEMAKTEAKKSDLETTAEKLTNKIDKSSAKSAQLKEEVTVLQEELANLAAEQKSMDKIRAEANAVFLEEKATLDKGLAGLRKALKIIRDYFGASASLVQTEESQPASPAGHQADGGAGGSIISILEVAEEDMAKELTLVTMQEADEVAAYEETTEENTMTNLAKNQDVKYKNQEAAGLDKAITELSNDLGSTNSELGSVNSYYTKLQGRCVAKPTSYEEKKKARDAEIVGLKEALNVLENEAALVQRGKKSGRNMRGALQL